MVQVDPPALVRLSEGLSPLVERETFRAWYRVQPKRGVGAMSHGPAWAAWQEATRVERERCADIARRWGETHADGETVNARNAGSKIARGIEGPNVRANLETTE